MPYAEGEAAAPILISGATGTLGRAFARICEERGLAYRLVSRQELDIASIASVDRALRELRPWAVVNAAGYVRVDDAEHEVERCFRENVTGPRVLATVCAQTGVRLVTFSSDLVFGGETDEPYVERHPPSPLNVYGRSKAKAEESVLTLCAESLVIRTGAFFGPWDASNFLHQAIASVSAGRPFQAAGDVVVSPTYVPDLVHATLDLLIDGEVGVWHLANQGALSWYDLARDAVGRASLSTDLVTARSISELALPAARPRFSALSSERGQTLPSLEDALSRFFEARTGGGAPDP